ncbi:MAG: hypothetical protein D6696_06815 [Acidobacteria bacterium]|nr:MAG: hypothetical protein D6696_06815 [Acidobacteriota bacterium]
MQNPRPQPLLKELLILLLAATLLAGAAGAEQQLNPEKASKKYGEIFVGSPEIVTRERLVNDRLRQERWLMAELDKSDEVPFDFQGQIDTRSLAGLVGQLAVSLDPNQGAVYDAQSQAFLAGLEREEQLARLEHRLAVLGKLKELRDFRNGNGASNGAKTADAGGDGGGGAEGEGGDDTTAPAANEANGGPPSQPADLLQDPSNAAFEALLKRLTDDEFAKSLAQPEPHETAAKASPVDRLRDRLAYREEIRNEIFENQLDDRHDVRGHTFYRFNVDATVLPRKNVDAWAVVELEVEPPELDGDFYDQLYDDWRRYVQRGLNELFLGRRARSQGCEKNPIERCALEPAARLGIIRHFFKCSAKNDCFADLTISVDDLYKEWQRCVAPGRDALSLLGNLFDHDPSDNREDAEQLCAQALDLALDSLSPDGVKDLDALLAAIVGLVAKDCAKGDHETELRHRRQALDLMLLSHIRGEWIEWGLDTYAKIEEVSVTQPYFIEVKECCAGKTKFKATIEELHSVYAYAATPKESVQRLSDVASNRRASELTAALSLLKGGVGAKGALSIIRQSQVLMNAISRQPLVVGFTRSDGNNGGPNGDLQDVAQLGWLIGPKFKIDKDRKGIPFISRWTDVEEGYAHVPIQNALAGSLVVPGWWDRARVTVKARWQPKKGEALAFEEKEYLVQLPRDLGAVTDAIATRREPVVYHYDAREVRQGQAARFLVMGENLWRSTRVTLGNQLSDRVEILPNMAGVVATFDPVKEPVNVDGTARDGVPVRLWTSDGVVLVSEVTVHPPQGVKLDVAFAGPRLVASGDKVKVTLNLVKGRLPAGHARIELGLKSAAVGCGWTYASVPVKQGDVRSFSATFEVAKLCGGDAKKKPASGAAMEAALAVYLRPSSPRPEIAATTGDATAVFYAKPEDAKVRVSCDDKEAVKVGDEVTFTFPLKVKEGFPAFSRAAAEPEVEVKKAPEGVTFEVQPVGAGWVDGDPLTYKVKVSAGEGSLADKQTAELHFKLKGSVDGLAMARATCPLTK